MCNEQGSGMPANCDLLKDLTAISSNCTVTATAHEKSYTVTIKECTGKSGSLGIAFCSRISLAFELFCTNV